VKLVIALAALVYVQMIMEVGVKKNTVPPSAVGEAPTKAQDDKEFLSRWIAYGKSLKAEADGFGIDWRSTSFEKWEGAITFAKVWAESQEEECETM